MKKIWISVVVFSFLALGVGRASADEDKHCLYYQYEDGKYTRYFCSPVDEYGMCIYHAGWNLSSDKFNSSESCQTKGKELIAETDREGYCYTSKAKECTPSRESDCRDTGWLGSQKFYYSADINAAKAQCENENIFKDVYCLNKTNLVCEYQGDMAIGSSCGSGQVMYSGKGKTKSDNETNCKKDIVENTFYCYKDGACTIINKIYRHETKCNGSGEVTKSKEECEGKIKNESKYCLYKKVGGEGDFYLCFPADGKVCKNQVVNEFGETPSDGDGNLYMGEDGPMSQAECLAKKKEGFCCMYKNNADSYTCACGASTVDGDNKCKATHSTYGQLYRGPYAGSTECNNDRPGELPKFKVDEPTEQLSHETLEKMNPLRHSLSNVFGNQSNRNPGYIISRLVKNIIFPISGLILFIQIIWAGFQVVQGGTTGNDNQVNSGKQRLISVIVGFLLLFASYWLWSLVELIFGIGIIEK